MKWSESDATAKINIALFGLSKIFGLHTFRWYEDSRLDPYVCYVMEYLEKKLILSGAVDIKQKIDVFDQFYKESMDQILEGKTVKLAKTIGISDEEGDEIKTSYRVFVAAITNFTSFLYLQLRYNYSNLFVEERVDCHACCCNGSSTSGDLIDFNYPDPRPMQDGYEFGCGTQELWGPGKENT